MHLKNLTMLIRLDIAPTSIHLIFHSENRFLLLYPRFPLPRKKHYNSLEKLRLCLFFYSVGIASTPKKLPADKWPALKKQYHFFGTGRRPKIPFSYRLLSLKSTFSLKCTYFLASGKVPLAQERRTVASAAFDSTNKTLFWRTLPLCMAFQ